MSDNCRVSSDELYFDQQNMARQINYECGNISILCLECRKKHHKDDMYHFSAFNDEEGLCDTCAESDDIREDWGIV
jgi:hypothetical protein